MQKTSSGLTVKPSTSIVGSSPLIAPLQLPSSTVEKNKQWQRELLMERIRSRASQQKSFTELSKSMRMSMLEKRYALDTVEKANLQKCLDSMQHCIKVTSRQGLVERLESLSRQLGLKFMEDTSGLFISTDMFYLEIMLDSNGALTDVKVHHECKIEQQSCSELVNCLNRGDFADFTVQLEGLSSIYQLNAEPKVKKKAFVALQAMETDLYNLYQIQQFSKDAQQLLESSAVGLVLKRRGGHPMRLTYFVAPYDLISLNDKSLQTLSFDLLGSKDVGMSVTVNLEAASANKLQILPTVTFVKDATTGIETPVYAPLTQLNSTLLPANFVLRLNKPLPVCSVTLRALLSSAASGGDSVASVGTTSTGLDHKCSPTASAKEIPSTIMNLIVQTASDQQLKNSSKGLFVCLPDQTHCYFFTENKQLKATLVSSVPFTEPSQVPIIIAFLKKHALFYALLSSCVRPQAKMGNDMDMTTILEVNAISFQQISVSLQHSFEESMATVDFSLTESSISCNIYALNRNYDILSIKLTNVVQKSLSIPITIRALLKFWEDERMKVFQRGVSGGAGGINASNVGSGSGNIANSNIGPTQTNNAYGNFNLAMGPSDPGGGGNSSNVGTSTKQELNIGVLQQRQFLVNPTNVGHFTGTAGVSGYFKSDHVKQEDFRESPKSETSQMQSLEASSLGQIINTQQQQKQQTADFTTVSTDLEIADKCKNIWKDKTTNLKNSVSITPIMQSLVGVVPTSENNMVLNSPNLDIKRTGIEIIPLMSQIDILTSNSNSSSNSSITSVNSGNSSNTQQSAASGSTTITITPITNVVQQQIVNSKIDKKDSGVNASTISGSASSKRNLIDTSSGGNVDQKEKKRSKKKRDDSPMGPPEKIFSRQNSPATIATVCSDGGNRKFTSPSSSPKASGGSGVISSSTIGTSSVISTPRPSPKHSPVYTSPKHQSTASNSPKSPFGTHSPKHGSSGKPSMSTLKSAAASLSPKGEKNTTGNLIGVGLGVCGSLAIGSATTTTTNILGRTLANAGGGSLSIQAVNSGYIPTTNVSSTTSCTISKNRDKDKITANLIPGGKVNVTSMPANIQQMKASTTLNHVPVATNSGLSNTFSTSVAIGGGMCNASATNTNTLDSVLRKSVTSSAVSLMTSTTVSSAITTLSTPPPHPVPPGNSDTLTNNEYRVKSSQEGLKLTINKTSNKSISALSPGKTKAKSIANTAMEQLLSSALPQSCIQLSDAKKLHTGLKPGVNSGPASSKKSAISLQSNHIITNANTPTTTLATTKTTTAGGGGTTQNAKRPFQKSYSSGSLSTKSFNISSAHTGTIHSSGSSMTSGTSISSGNSSSSNASNSSSSLSNDSYCKLAKGGFERESERCSASTSIVSHTLTRPDHHVDMMRILQFASPMMAANMEGFMNNVSEKFQIPKLSQRSVVEHAQCASKAMSEPTTPTSMETSAKIFFSTRNFDRGNAMEAIRHPTATNFSNRMQNEQEREEQQHHQQGQQQQQQQQQQQHHQQHQQHQELSLHQTQSTLMNVTRPPPPPYHAAIAASAAAKTAGLAAPPGTTTKTPIKTTTTPTPITTTPIPVTATTPSTTILRNQQQGKRNDVVSTVEEAILVNAYIVGK